MDRRATYRQISIFILHRDMQAMTMASGMAGINPILAIALGIVSMICPICRCDEILRYVCRGSEAPT